MPDNELTVERQPAPEQTRRQVRIALGARERLAEIRRQTDGLDGRGVEYTVEDTGRRVWFWIEDHFPVRREGTHEAFVDWDAVDERVWTPLLPTGAPAIDPVRWLAEVRRQKELGDAEVFVTWNFDLALRMRLDDVVANADVVSDHRHAWVLCEEGGWLLEFRAGRYMAWARCG